MSFSMEKIMSGFAKCLVGQIFFVLGNRACRHLGKHLVSTLGS
jgi:hypothetical protein